jgi:hypothetical protein
MVSVATLCRVGLGLGLGDPWVAQAWPKGHPSVTQGRPKGRFSKVLLFATKVGKRGEGGRKSPESSVIADIARDRKSKTSPRMNTDDTDQESVIGKANSFNHKGHEETQGQGSKKKGPDRAFLRLLILGEAIGRGKAAGRHCSLH